MPPFQNASTQMWSADDAASGDDERGQRDNMVVAVRCIVRVSEAFSVHPVRSREDEKQHGARGWNCLPDLRFAGRPAQLGSQRAYPNGCQHWAAF